jgi:hypothetical protein
MLIAPDVNDPEYWHQRAKEARRVAERTIDETAKQTMLSVAEDCDSFAVRAAMRSIDALVVRRLLNETRGS